ncbi:hypothetical protein DEAC_c27950 [Desulfosporosinus acididurans]|uniref:Uncharacterized protein n=1 Tax=Desulfosporosinus acididurans TaxID=476652 RepID=A0A0J1FQJ1_9FIRM|nr:hypothetical protein [Desulfosporosinus acididurans]KLU65243.1 hypothetical protein DEAC_c27950 [Desulfosporosinus acididurans]
MAKFYKALWYLAILVFVITMAAFTMGILLMGVLLVGTIGVLRFYWKRKHYRSFNKNNTHTHFASGEIIDITPKSSSDNVLLKLKR